MIKNKSQIESQSDPGFRARVAIYTGPYQDELLTDYTVNLSSSGLFIATDRILPVDDPLRVQFKLPKIDRIITCNTKVAWVNCPPPLKKASLSPEMGIQFLDLSREDMHVIMNFIGKDELIPTW
jgi:uncharacterized protein (TIGR02266 family)